MQDDRIVDGTTPTNVTFSNVPFIGVLGQGGASERNLHGAIESWGELLGQTQINKNRDVVEQHGQNTIGSAIRGSIVLYPKNKKQIRGIVEVSAKYKVPLYPVSTGRNWGYGAASPTVAGSAVVDLSALNEIEIVDRDLGLVKLQPGVTQGQLYQYLQENAPELMVPVHGGGPTCSLLGNALERGYGITPTADHFLALNSLEAVLADGSTYQSPFHAMGAPLIGAAHRWGIGPYVEGLFSQGNFGVVTEGTFALKRRAEHVEAFFVKIKSDEDLEETIVALRDLLSSLGGSIAGINVMNNRRVLSMSHPYPRDKVRPGEILSDKLCSDMSKVGGITAWTLAGVLHCPKRMIRNLRKEISSRLPKVVSRPIFMNRQRLKMAARIGRWLPKAKRDFLVGQTKSIHSLLDLADGIPSRVALPLAYWLQGGFEKTAGKKHSVPHPSRDNCGLIWFSPLVPMKSDVVTEFTKTVKRVCQQHAIEPLITLTTLSERLLDSTVPILYRPTEDGATERANECYQRLVEECLKLGCSPYRLKTSSMSSLPDKNNSHWSIVNKLKLAIDPDDLISPGRYSS